MKNYFIIFLGTFSTLLFFSLLPASADQNFDEKISQEGSNQFDATSKNEQKNIKQWVRTIQPAAGPAGAIHSPKNPYWQQTVTRNRSRSRVRRFRE